MLFFEETEDYIFYREQAVFLIFVSFFRCNFYLCSDPHLLVWVRDPAARAGFTLFTRGCRVTRWCRGCFGGSRADHQIKHMSYPGRWSGALLVLGRMDVGGRMTARRPFPNGAESALSRVSGPVGDQLSWCTRGGGHAPVNPPSAPGARQGRAPTHPRDGCRGPAHRPWSPLSPQGLAVPKGGSGALGPVSASSQVLGFSPQTQREGSLGQMRLLYQSWVV